jgi:hypothetical protein
MKAITYFSFLAVLTGSVASAADDIAVWNKAMITATLTAPATAAPLTQRVAAIVHAAVFDAVNGIDRKYTPIFVPPAAAPGASGGAAAVQAAYATLVSLYPAQQSTFDQQRTASLGAITDTQNVVDPEALGIAVADYVMAHAFVPLSNEQDGREQ